MTVGPVRLDGLKGVLWRTPLVPKPQQLQLANVSLRLRRGCVSRAKGEEKGGGLGDELLDFMYAGKKLRKWYGEQDLVLPKDGGEIEDGSGADESSREEIIRDKVAILFPEEYPMAEQVLLQFILLRESALVVTKDVPQARSGYGSYVDIVKGDSISSSLLSAQSVVICGSVSPKLVSSIKAAKVPHIVLLSGVSSSASQSIFSGIFSSAETKDLLNASRENYVKETGISYSIVRVDPRKLSTLPGGSSLLTASSGGENDGNIPREDVALCLALCALKSSSSEDASRIIHLSSRGTSGEPSSVAATIEERETMIQDLLSNS